MNTLKKAKLINFAPLPNIPWEDRPDGLRRGDILWRYSKNPVIPRNATTESNSIFNSAVVPFRDGFAGVFRCDDTARHMDIHAGFSPDGISWSIADHPIDFTPVTGDLPSSDYKYDPRVVFI